MISDFFDQNVALCCMKMNNGNDLNDRSLGDTPYSMYKLNTATVLISLANCF